MLFLKICFGGTNENPTHLKELIPWKSCTPSSFYRHEANTYPLLESILRQCGLENTPENRKALQDAVGRTELELISTLECCNHLLLPLKDSNIPLPNILKVIKTITQISFMYQNIFQTQILLLWMNGMEQRGTEWCKIICSCGKIPQEFLEKTIANTQIILKYNFLTEPMTPASHFKILRAIFQDKKGIYCVHAMALIILAQEVKMSPHNYAEYVEQHILSTLYCLHALVGSSATKHPIPALTRCITHMPIATQEKFMHCVKPLLLDSMSFETKCQIVDHCITIDITELETTTQNIQKIWDENPSLSEEEKIEILITLLNSNQGLRRANEIISKIIHTKKQNLEFVPYVLSLIPSNSCCCQ